MSNRRVSWGRREFVGGLSLAGTAVHLGVGPDSVAAEPPPETRRIRFVRIPSICRAPQYVRRPSAWAGLHRHRVRPEGGWGRERGGISGGGS